MVKPCIGQLYTCTEVYAAAQVWFKLEMWSGEAGGGKIDRAEISTCTVTWPGGGGGGGGGRDVYRLQYMYIM